MTLPADSLNVIPRAQYALFVTGSDGEPLEKIIQDLEAQQVLLTGDIPAELDALEVSVTAAAAAATAAGVAAAAAQADATDALADAATAQTTADTGVTNAAAAQVTASAAAAKLAADTFLTVSNNAADLPASRRVAVSGRIQAVDAGAGSTLTFSLTDQNVILPADVSDITGAFVNATGLLGALAINSTYIVEGLLTFQSGGLTVGLGLTFTLPAGASIVGGYDHSLTTTTLQAAYNNASGAVSANTTGVPVTAANLPIRGRWIIKTGATAGNAQLQFRTGTIATAITLKQDLSVLRFLKIG